MMARGTARHRVAIVGGGFGGRAPWRTFSVRTSPTPHDPQQWPPVAPMAGGHRPRGAASLDNLQVNDRVRLREDYFDLPRGAVGVVIGFFRRERPTCVMRFERGVREVPFDLLEPLGEDD